MEEVKEVLVEEVNTSTSNQRKKEAFIKTLKEAFKDNLEGVFEHIEYYKSEILRRTSIFLQEYHIEYTEEKYPVLLYSRRKKIQALHRLNIKLNPYKQQILDLKIDIDVYKAIKKSLSNKVRRYVSDFDSMANILDSTYGENRWDVIGSRIVIHFTDFYIKNHSSKNYIKDLYVFIEFNKDFFNISLEGRRATLSPIEYLKGYSHSHLSAGRFGYGTFCLGSGPIAQTILVLREEYLEDVFQLFLYQINEYITWESLEGGPYRKIRNLYANTKVNYKRAVNRYYYRDFIRYKVKYSISRSNNTIQVSIDEEDFLRKIQLSDSDKVIKFEGKYYRGTMVYDMPGNFRSDELFVFNGKVIKTKVELTNAEYEYETTVHPKILWYIKERLIRDITKKSKIARNSDGTSNSSSDEERLNVETLVHNL